MPEREQQFTLRGRFPPLGGVEDGEPELIQTCRLFIGQESKRSIACTPHIGERTFGVAAGDCMVCEFCQMRARLIAVERLQDIERPPVKAHPARLRQSFVERVADEDMGEAQAAVTARNVGDDSRQHGVVERLEECVFGDAAQPRQSDEG